MWEMLITPKILKSLQCITLKQSQIKLKSAIQIELPQRIVSKVGLNEEAKVNLQIFSQNKSYTKFSIADIIQLIKISTIFRVSNEYYVDPTKIFSSLGENLKRFYRRKFISNKGL